MPQINDLTIKDGQTTPADVVFGPQGLDSNGVAMFATSASQQNLKKRLGVSVRPPVNGNGMYRLTITLGLPKGNLPLGGSVELVDHRNTARVELMIHERSTEQEIKDLRALIANSLSQALVKAAIEKLEPFF